jgi:hypothetical protein
MAEALDEHIKTELAAHYDEIYKGTGE